MVLTFNKLVRDGIPAKVIANGEQATFRILTDDAAYRLALRNKVLEEAQEVYATPNVEELADLLEVIYALGQTLGVSPAEIEEARVAKRKARGGFLDRVFLISTQ